MDLKFILQFLNVLKIGVFLLIHKSATCFDTFESHFIESFHLKSYFNKVTFEQNLILVQKHNF